MRKPGRTRQGVIMLKSPISLKLGTNVRYQELTYVTESQVKILNSLGDPGIPCKHLHFARFMHNYLANFTMPVQQTEKPPGT